MEEEFFDLSSFAVNDADMEGLSLLETVKKVKPNILIGEHCAIVTPSTGQHQLFRSVGLRWSLQL